jgi:hypothetical protein
VGREIWIRGGNGEEREKKRINAEDTERHRGHRERKKERRKERAEGKYPTLERREWGTQSKEKNRCLSPFERREWGTPE